MVRIKTWNDVTVTVLSFWCKLVQLFNSFLNKGLWWIVTPNVTPVQHVEGARCPGAKATHGLLRTCYLPAAVAQCLPCAHVSDVCVLQVLIRVHCCTMLYLFIFPAQVEDLAADTWKNVEDFNDCKEVNYLCNQKHQWSSIITNLS